MRSPSVERKKIIGRYDEIAEARRKGVPWRSIIEEIDRDTGEDNSAFTIMDVHRSITLTKKSARGGNK